EDEAERLCIHADGKGAEIVHSRSPGEIPAEAWVYQGYEAKEPCPERNAAIPVRDSPCQQPHGRRQQQRGCQDEKLEGPIKREKLGVMQEGDGPEEERRIEVRERHPPHVGVRPTE